MRASRAQLAARHVDRRRQRDAQQIADVDLLGPRDAAAATVPRELAALEAHQARRPPVETAAAEVRIARDQGEAHDAPARIEVGLGEHQRRRSLNIAPRSAPYAKPNSMRCDISGTERPADRRYTQSITSPSSTGKNSARFS